MANSIVSALSRILTPDVIGKIAAAVGLERSLAQPAIAAMVPAILSALIGLVGRPGGARQLADAVARQPADMLSSVGDGRGGSAEMASRGTSLLTSLLGGGALGTLASTLARFAGIGEGSTRSLMGMLTPIIMGVLGNEQRAAGLDASGLANMLTGQQKEIAAAMPSGLSQLLEASGLHEHITSPGAAERSAYEAPGTSPQVAAMQRANNTTGRGVSWPYWVLPLLVLGGLLWYLLPRERETVPVAGSKTTSEPTQAVLTKSAFLSNAPDSWVSIGSAPNEYVNKEIYSRTGEQLGTVRDVLVEGDRKMAAVIINVGRYLGIGDKEVAVPFSALQVTGQRMVIDTTKDALQAAPTFVRRKSSKQ
jgi:sporulation protein YlmC with PRC-barrel domain